ncbi:hypothetical protein [Desertibacillus haloalkaliphilus]|uniref:hypothetical protein n=1 Tax=Desertibacillus haloalkaliphilus TaxID=1328930 RepID=UPI0028A9CA18|nr:hypothetical protein [Desertibacillus haloalkaliphilus]
MSHIPITGLIFSDGEGSLHSHHLYITIWDGKSLHTHELKAVTSFDVGHDHRYAATTEPSRSVFSTPITLIPLRRLIMVINKLFGVIQDQQLLFQAGDITTN